MKMTVVVLRIIVEGKVHFFRHFSIMSDAVPFLKKDIQ